MGPAARLSASNIDSIVVFVARSRAVPIDHPAASQVSSQLRERVLAVYKPTSGIVLQELSG
jgi:hypothetical protein